MKESLAELFGFWLGLILFYVLPVVLLMLAFKWIFL